MYFCKNYWRRIWHCHLLIKVVIWRKSISRTYWILKFILGIFFEIIQFFTIDQANYKTKKVYLGIFLRWLIIHFLFFEFCFHFHFIQKSMQVNIKPHLYHKCLLFYCLLCMHAFCIFFSFKGAKNGKKVNK